MPCSVQFYTAPTVDTPGTILLLLFGEKRYLFGSVAEGTQRALNSVPRLSKISHVFLTGRTQWRDVGGLFGLILSLGDAVKGSAAAFEARLRQTLVSKRKRKGETINDIELERTVKEKLEDIRQCLTLFGPKNLNYFLATGRRFIFRHSLPLEAHEVPEPSESSDGPQAAEETQPLFEDDNTRIFALSIAPERVFPSSSPSTANAPKSPRKRSFSQMHGIERNPDDVEAHSILDVAKSMVRQMFAPLSRHDRLVEKPLQSITSPTVELFVRNAETNKIDKYEGPRPGGSGSIPKMNVLVHDVRPSQKITHLPPAEPATNSVSYILRNRELRGKFDPAKALALGLRDKSRWGLLAKGESLQNDKGETVTPDMIMGEPRHGGAAAFIDLPSIDYVGPFVRRWEELSDHLTSDLNLFVWILGPGVLKSPELKTFLKQRKDVEHVVSSQDVCANRLTMTAVANQTVRLSAVDPAHFVPPYHDNTATHELKPPFRVAERGLNIRLDTSQVLTDQIVPLFDEQAARSEIGNEVHRLATIAHDEIQKDATALEAWADKLPQKNAEIFTLGTGSATPSNFRNVSATLLRIPGWGAVLLDCGEGTLGQLKRVFPPDEFAQVMRELRMIWISHMHGDHHLGTVGVIKAWYGIVYNSKPPSNSTPSAADMSIRDLFADQPRLAVVSAAPMLDWLHEYSSVEDYGYSCLAPLAITPARYDRASQDQIQRSQLTWFKPTGSSTDDPLSAFQSWVSERDRLTVAPARIGLADIQVVAVNHCHAALAVSITLPSRFKVSYSGDCRPSSPFSRIGRNSTVCIHEATFDDELHGDALAKKHSTTSEALQVAANMRAKSVVLTHFSQRYQKVPVLEYDVRGETETTTAEATTDASSMVEDDDVPMTDDEDPASTDMNNSNGTDPFDSEDRPQTSSATTDGEAPLDPTKATAPVKLRIADTDMKVCMAFDYMRIKVGEIAQMEKFTPALLELFADDERRSAAEKLENAEKNRALRRAKIGGSGLDEESGDGGEGEGEGEENGKGGSRKGSGRTSEEEEKRMGKKARRKARKEEKSVGKGAEAAAAGEKTRNEAEPVPKS